MHWRTVFCKQRVAVAIESWWEGGGGKVGRVREDGREGRIEGRLTCTNWNARKKKINCHPPPRHKRHFPVVSNFKFRGRDPLTQRSRTFHLSYASPTRLPPNESFLPCQMKPLPRAPLFCSLFPFLPSLLPSFRPRLDASNHQVVPTDISHTSDLRVQVDVVIAERTDEETAKEDRKREQGGLEGRRWLIRGEGS